MIALSAKKGHWAIAAAAALALGVSIAAVPAAMAQEKPAPNYGAHGGWYTGLAGGLNHLEDAELSGPGLLAGENAVNFGMGWVGSASVGYDFGWYRAEAEANYRANTADSITRTVDAFGTTVDSGTTGGVGTFGFMANALIDVFRNYPFTPYLGAGAGWAKIDSDIAGIDDSEGEFVFQGIAGFSYLFLPNTHFTIDYRYFSTFGDVEIQTSTVPIGGVARDMEFNNHSVLLGLRFTFDEVPSPTVSPQPGIVRTPTPAPMHRAAEVPAPPPPPVAEPRIPETYVVFFAFDRSEISPVAAQVLERAIADFRQNGLTRIVVEGHADRSGSDAYNENISRARAQSVATFLIGRGVATENIETAWFGEARPRVETDDGVRNEENRRAEIFLRQ